MINFIKTKHGALCKDNVCKDFPGFTERNGGSFGFLDCSFLKSDLNMMFRTLYDLSVEARILCALSCCIGFFGAVFVYFFLLVLHHYNTEIFFDTGKNIFTGFEGYGNTKKNIIMILHIKKGKLGLKLNYLQEMRNILINWLIKMMNNLFKQKILLL